MELRHLRYFLVLCQELHFTEAAFKLRISQPTLSQQIKLLESEVGLPLFDRIGKKITKTQAGEVLEEYAKGILDKTTEAQLAMDDLKAEWVGTIRLAVLPSDLDYRMSHLLKNFHQDYPQIKVTIIPSIDISEKLLSNQVDIGVGLLGTDNDGLCHQHIYTESYDLYVHPDHYLAKQGQIKADELKDLPWISFPEGYYGRQLIDHWAQQNRLKLTPIMESGSAASQFQLVAENVGVTIQPRRLIEALGHQAIVSVEIEEGPIREVAIAYVKGKYLSKAMTALIEHLSYLD